MKRATKRDKKILEMFCEGISTVWLASQFGMSVGDIELAMRRAWPKDDGKLTRKRRGAK